MHYNSAGCNGKLMYIPDDDTQNYLFCKLQLDFETFELNKPTNQNSIKVPKVGNKHLLWLLL